MEGVWREVKGVEEMEAEGEAAAARVKRLNEGLAKCRVCGGKAEVSEYGVWGTGVKVGCKERGGGAECDRYELVYEEGVSLEEAAKEWNFENGGIMGLIRALKKRVREKYGKMARWEKKRARAERRERAEREAEMKRLAKGGGGEDLTSGGLRERASKE